MIPYQIIKELKRYQNKRLLNIIYKYDKKRIIRYCYTFNNKADNLIAQIILRYHVVEKGLVMPDTKHGFGIEIIKDLVMMMEKYGLVYSACIDSQYLSAMQVLESYHDRHADSSKNDPELNRLLSMLECFLENVAQTKFDTCVNEESISGGCVKLTREEYINQIKGSWPSFSQSRYTIRDLLNKEVSMKDISDIIQWAGKSPSACNRQPWRVYVICAPRLIKDILELQGGARGFGQTINKLLIICGDISQYDGIVERNQVYVDCGIFVMSLLCGIHFKGLGGCALHWSVEPNKDKTIRKLIPALSASNNIICLIGVGHLKDSFSVAYSQRRKLNEILTIIN